MLYNGILNDFINNLMRVSIGQLSQSILCKKEIFKSSWCMYKQVYKFDEISNNLFDTNFEEMNGYQLVEKLKSLPFDTFIIKPCSSEMRYLNVLFRQNRVNMKSYDEEKLLLVSCFVVNNYLCIFFSPTDLTGKMSRKSFVIKFDLEAPVDYSLYRYDSELAGLKYGKNHVTSEKLQYASSVRKSVEHLIYHLLYLSMCYERELPQNINYITSNRTYNIVSDYKITINNSDTDFYSKIISNNEVKYYRKNDFANGTSKSTHARRGHEHRFWVGSGEDKKLVTKWLKPMIINEDKEDLRTLVTNV